MTKIVIPGRSLSQVKLTMPFVQDPPPAKKY